jgi:parvulin-like peptidyl-prolyl isomerase
MAISTEISDVDILEQVKISLKMPEITEQIIMNRIIREEAEKAEIKVEIKELQETADEFRARNKLIRAKSTQIWLAMNRLSLDEFEGIIRLELLSNKLRDLVVPDKKVEEYFYQHQLDFDRAVLYEVVLENKELANELYYSVQEGEIKFPDVANKYIKNVELMRKGGYLGLVSRKELNPALISVFSVNFCPRIIKPISTALGFHLIWVEEIIKATLDEDIQNEIRNQLFKKFLMSKIDHKMLTDK